MPDGLTVVMRVITEWDPINLVAHAPDDEYQYEAEQILSIITVGISDLDLGKGIETVFRRAFGEDRFTASQGECIRIARRILSLTSPEAN